MKIKSFLSIILSIITTILFTGCGGGGGSGSSGGGSSDTTAPDFTSDTSFTMTENHVSVVTVQADDDSNVTYSITGGDDREYFVIDEYFGTLRFKARPDYEDPKTINDANDYTIKALSSDNTYNIIVTATDTSNNQAHQNITVTITDIDEDSLLDNDSDHIPENIEILIGMNPNDSDENNNSIEDGLDSVGAHGDTFFDKQWHIRSLGTVVNDSNVPTIEGNDLDLLDIYANYMGYNKGNNIIVQVVDTGVDADHEDLSNNMDLTRSYDGTNVGDPSPNTLMRSYEHGTMVAGIMAAEAFNGKGVRGIVPFASIAGSNWLETQGTIELNRVWLTGEGANEIAVTNNSWGSYFGTSTLYEEIMALGTSTLRDGKGRVYVFAAGNDRGRNGNANLQYSLSNRYAIAVAALKHDNTHASYSNPGSNILVSGYSGNYASDSPTIGTTTVMGTAADSRTWAEDTNRNYTFAMNGTSSASPTVAASIALVLEACPDLTWRDVKYLTAKHAKRIDESNPSWVENNSSLWHSIDYGFGLINAKGMIDECTSNYTNLSAEQNITAIKTFNTFIADNNTTYSFTVNMPTTISIEWIEVTIDNNSTSAQDYKVELTSPHGSKTTLMTEKAEQGGSWMDGGFRLSTAAMMNETSNGNWTIDITDTWADDNGTLKNIELKIYGH